MSSPSQLVSDAFAQAQNYASDAQSKLTLFTNKLNDALQLAPLVNIAFDAIADPGTDTLSPYVPPSDYTSTLLTSLGAGLIARLGGGTGLAPSVEAAIWDRARERELATAQAAIDQVTRDTEALGFTLPTGVLNDGIRREMRAYYDKTSGLSRDVAIKQADLEQVNMQKTYEQAVQFETTLADILAKRSQVSLDTYRADVERFRAQVEQDVKHWEIAIKQLEAQIVYTRESQRLNSELVRANLATVLEAAKTGAQVYAQLAASAYSLIHATAAVSGTSGTTVGYNYSNQTVDQPSALSSI